MIAVYKRELRSYLTSMIGYLFIFFILLLTGIYFSAYQLGASYPRFEYTLSALTFVFLISVPILTMRVLAEERKQKTDQLLLTAPVSVEKIVLGKYFALVTIFAIPMLIMCFYPLLMTKFGTVSLGAAYTAVLGFFLLGCANLAIGVFISSLTESQVIAAVLTNFAHLPVVQNAFGGIRVVVGVLIINAVSGMWKKSVVDKLGIILAIISFVVATFVDISPVWLVLLGAVIGIVVKSFQAKEKGGAK